VVAAAQAQPREEDLAKLRARIDALAGKLEAKEGTRREARDALRDSERAISQANRRLARLAGEERALRVQAGRIAERRRDTQKRLDAQRGALERMLAARAASPAPETLRVALSGDDPAAVPRRLRYAGYVSRAAAAQLAAYRGGLDELERLGRDAEERRARLRAVELESRADRARLVAQQRERKVVLARVQKEVRASRREMKVLRADETRLARLVEEIGRVFVRVEREPEAASQSTARRVAFASLRGKLSLPVRGELTGRFGAPRGAGVDAKGVFIRAPEGRPVKAIAAGQVAFADWMRGFGNLLIVDHGDGYLSIYANNESLLKQVGENVTAGESVATTGSSGGNEETGLYFEMRHLGRAFDPLRWVRLK
jgi:septal ring factor EnvC (AmiA/AmiB activator)